MSNKKLSQEEDRKETIEKSTMNRRLFLKGTAAAGLGALTLSTIGCADDKAQPQVATAVPTPTRSTISTRVPPVEPVGNAQITLQGLKENWKEPMVWRVGDWPGQQLDLTAVYHSAPLAVLGFFTPNGTPGANPNLNPDGTDLLFSYNGIAPGPTIRMRGDETLFLKLRNLLPLNSGQSNVPEPDPNSTEPGAFITRLVDDWCLGEHVNGIHSTHTTNFHTHGLHVRPGRNPDGTHSDNIFLRILPQADWKMRSASDDPNCNFLKPMETVAQADYQFRLGDVGAKYLQDYPEIAKMLGHTPGAGAYPHPEGTFWYHPHPHGATFWQVTGGMAGFLLVEGVTDDAIRRALCSDCQPEQLDPAVPAGQFNYRERLMFMQRVKAFRSAGPDPDAPQAGNRAVNNTAFAPLINGTAHPLNITMTPKTVERWRILNGSVDSYGYVRIYVLKGDWPRITDSNSPYFGQLTADGSNPVSDEALASAAVAYKLLAFDGVTLVNDPNDPYPNPISGGQSGMNTVRYTFQNIDSSNPVTMSVANRADILFEAPELTKEGEDDVYTIVARNWGYVTDRIAVTLSKTGSPDAVGAAFFPADTVIAHLIVSRLLFTITYQGQNGFDATVNALKQGNITDDLKQQFSQHNFALGDSAKVVSVSSDSWRIEEPDGAYFVSVEDNTANTLNVSSVPDENTADPFALIFDELAPDKSPVQPYLQPVLDEELALTKAELGNRKMKVGGGDPQPLTGTWYRKRLVTYSGWGGGYPFGQSSLVAAKLQEMYPVRKMNTTTGDTMAIDGFKFNPDLVIHTMNRNTAEEWVLQNCSMTLYGTPGEKQNPTTDIDPRVWAPLPPDQQFLKNSDFAAESVDVGTVYPVSAAVDHPFHIHQNPFWVTERWLVSAVDAQTGDVTLEKDPNWKPRWQDVIQIPRNGGRIVFRTRFWDFLGNYVNHCHLLLHEDNGMMQPITVIEEEGAITVEPYRGEIVYNADGSIDSIVGNLANYAVAPANGLTDSGANRNKTTWSSTETDIWPRVKTRLDCFLQNQTAVDTSALPVNPLCIPEENPDPMSTPQPPQGLLPIGNFCAPLAPISTPTPSSGG